MESEKASLMGAPHYLITFQGRQVSTEKEFLTGIELRELLGVAPGYDLIIERHGENADVVLQDFEVVRLSEGPIHVFVRPPTAFGS